MSKPPVFLDLTESEWVTLMLALGFVHHMRNTRDWKRFLRDAASIGAPPSPPLAGDALADLAIKIGEQAGRQLS